MMMHKTALPAERPLLYCLLLRLDLTLQPRQPLDVPTARALGAVGGDEIGLECLLVLAFGSFGRRRRLAARRCCCTTTAAFI